MIKASVSGASLDPLEHTKPVTVLSFRRPPPEFVWFNLNNPILVGESGQLEGGADWFTPIEWREDATGGAWKSSNRSVVSITPSGFYNARRTGTTIISLEFEGTRRDVEIVVVAP